MGNKVSQCFFSFPLFVCVFVRVCASSLEYVSLAVFANYMWSLKSFKEAERCVLSSLVLMLYIQKIFHCLPYLLYRLICLLVCSRVLWENFGMKEYVKCSTKINSKPTMATSTVREVIVGKQRKKRPLWFVCAYQDLERWPQWCVIQRAIYFINPVRSLRPQ